MKLREKCSVDAGCVCLITLEYARKWGYTPKPDLTPEVLVTGKFKATLIAYKTWNGAVKAGPVEMETKEGLVLGDLCYVIEDKWGDLLEETGFLRNIPGVYLDTGGDGDFEVQLLLEPVE